MPFNNIRLVLFFTFQFSCLNLFGADSDSLFFKALKNFFFTETGTSTGDDLYTKWKINDDPYFLLYVSKKDSVKTPGWWERQFPFFNCYTEAGAHEKDSIYSRDGDVTFIYKTYAMADGLLNKRFMSYRKETQCFIVFHELMHNFISRLKLKIPYEFNEALSDIMGNYCTLQFSKSTMTIDKTIAEDQLKTNEKIYNHINFFIKKINRNPRKALTFNNRCEKKIQSLLKKADPFQKDRFDYKVNNAYLLKNKFYSENYFLLKKVLHKQKTIRDFIELIKLLPGNDEDCKKYLSELI